MENVPPVASICLEDLCHSSQLNNNHELVPSRKGRIERSNSVSVTYSCDIVDGLAKSNEEIFPAIASSIGGLLFSPFPVSSGSTLFISKSILRTE